MPGSLSSSTAVARLTLSKTDDGAADPAASSRTGGGANAVPTAAPGDGWRTADRDVPLNDRRDSIVRSRPGPIPGTRSRPARLPNAPWVSRWATMALASASPTRGRRASSAALAASASTRSPAVSGRLRRMALSFWAPGEPAGSTERSWTWPGGSPGRLTRYLTPCPATASASKRRTALRSGESMKDVRMIGRTAGRRNYADTYRSFYSLLTSASATSPTTCRLPGLTLSIVSSVVCQAG
jgi:hypothetical protein